MQVTKKTFFNRNKLVTLNIELKSKPIDYAIAVIDNFIDTQSSPLVKVFFESGTHAELVATFDSEELFIACLPILEAEAKKQNMFVTEEVINL
jgi:hypothetical protein